MGGISIQIEKNGGKKTDRRIAKRSKKKTQILLSIHIMPMPILYYIPSWEKSYR